MVYLSFTVFPWSIIKFSSFVVFFAAEIPTLSILNLLEDNDDYCPPSTTSVSCSQSNTFLDFAKLPSHDSEILTKLHLKSLTQYVFV